MINLMSAAPSRADSSIVDASAVSSGSPMAAGAGSQAESGAAEGQPAGRKQLFGALLASAYGSSPRSSLAGGRGNGLPVPPLEEREVGAGIRLITAEGAERPGEEALFAFAMSQGLDASLVASVLWPGMATPDESGSLVGQSTEGAGAVVDGLAGLADASGTEVPASSDIIAGLLAGILPGRLLGAGSIGAGSWNAGGATEDMSPGGPSAEPLQDMACLGQSGVIGGGIVSGAGHGTLISSNATGTDIAALGSFPGSVSDMVNSMALGAAAGQVGGLGASQTAIGGTSMSDPLAPRIDSLGASQAVTSLSTSNFGAIPAVGSDSTQLADPHLSAAVRLSDAKVQVRLMGEAGRGLPALAGTASGSSLSSIPAQWVLMGAVGGGLNNPENGMLAESDDDGSMTELTDSSLVPDLEGTGPYGLDAHHRHPAGRGAAMTTDPIDLSVDGARGAASTDPDSENGLAKRLAEGVAQRMLAAVSSNNWKLQIDLKPAHLGHISVEMSMQQGQLEAVFDAGQASARQLISEGFDRLRQDLQRAGMNVAHLGLNFGAGAGTGGKPTPRGREAQSDQEGRGSVQGATMAASGARTGAGADGLDVMV